MDKLEFIIELGDDLKRQEQLLNLIEESLLDAHLKFFVLPAKSISKDYGVRSSLNSIAYWVFDVPSKLFLTEINLELIIKDYPDFKLSFIKNTLTLTYDYPVTESLIDIKDLNA